MLVVVSPAKTLDYESPLITEKYTQPELQTEIATLIQVCQQLSVADISQLMKVSDKIATLNVERFGNWQAEFNVENARQAILAFKGDVYTGLDATSLSAADLEYAQQNLRMLSGLYGVLRPLDLMQPYRLEMGTKLATEQGNSLYQFWDSKITEHLNKVLAENETSTLVNLASNEYFKAVKKPQLNAEIITPIFKDCKNDQYKVISFYAKKARGLMARYIIQHKIDTVEGLKAFDVAGYYFVAEESDATNLVFKRAEQIK